MTRREFLDAAAASAATLAVSSTAKSYGQIMGSNDRVNFAVIGLNSRAYAHLSSLKANKAKARIAYVCDVESNILAKYAANTEKEMGEAPKTEKDFRNVLALKEIDAITIATPDHWHAPMAIAGVQAGKHVYVEKPCSHKPRRRRDADRGAEEDWQAGPDGIAAAVFAALDRDRRQDPQRRDRPRLLRPRPGTRTSANRSAPARKFRFPQRWTGTFFRVQRRASPIKTTSSPITGTGSRSGAPAKH